MYKVYTVYYDFLTLFISRHIPKKKGYNMPMQWLKKETPVGLFVLAVAVGVGGAFGAAIFDLLIHLTTLRFYGHNGSTSFLSLIGEMSSWQRILIPTLGGLLVGIIFKLAKVSEAEGEGVPEVMEALAHHRGTIRPIVAPIKIVTAALTLGSGGSAGREGPIIQIGSAIGSSIAQRFTLSTHGRGLLLAAGAAAAIGGTFGAPIAGVLFTYEILKHKPGLKHLLYVATASTVGYYGASFLTSHPGLRFDTVFSLSFDSTLIITLIVLIVTAGTTALLFEKVLHVGKHAFSRIHAPHMIKPALGGLAIGLIGLYVPYIHEPAAYPMMVDLLSFSSIPVSLLVVVLVIKIVATSITLGSGGSGGIFAPLLFIGAILGTLLSGFVGDDSTALVIVSAMAATFAAAASAPLTAAVICFELTSAPLTVLPVFFLVSYGASLLYKLSGRRSIYSLPPQA